MSINKYIFSLRYERGITYVENDDSEEPPNYQPRPFLTNEEKQRKPKHYVRVSGVKMVWSVENRQIFMS